MGAESAPYASSAASLSNEARPCLSARSSAEGVEATNSDGEVLLVALLLEEDLLGLLDRRKDIGLAVVVALRLDVRDR